MPPILLRGSRSIRSLVLIAAGRPHTVVKRRSRSTARCGSSPRRIAALGSTALPLSPGATNSVREPHQHGDPEQDMSNPKQSWQLHEDNTRKRHPGGGEKQRETEA